MTPEEKHNSSKDMIRILAISAVIVETICIILLIGLLSLPKDVVGVMSGEYRIVRVEE